MGVVKNEVSRVWGGLCERVYSTSAGVSGGICMASLYMVGMPQRWMRVWMSLG